jgi:hypothetical protein
MHSRHAAIRAVKNILEGTLQAACFSATFLFTLGSVLAQLIHPNEAHIDARLL